MYACACKRMHVYVSSRALHPRALAHHTYLKNERVGCRHLLLHGINLRLERFRTVAQVLLHEIKKLELWQEAHADAAHFADSLRPREDGTKHRGAAFRRDLHVPRARGSVSVNDLHDRENCEQAVQNKGPNNDTENTPTYLVKKANVGTE